jgi:hypothetical protein
MTWQHGNPCAKSLLNHRVEQGIYPHLSPGAYETNKRIATTARNSLKGEGKTDFFSCSVNGKMGALHRIIFHW